MMWSLNAFDSIKQFAGMEVSIFLLFSFDGSEGNLNLYSLHTKKSPSIESRAFCELNE